MEGREGYDISKEMSESYILNDEKEELSNELQEAIYSQKNTIKPSQNKDKYIQNGTQLTVLNDLFFYCRKRLDDFSIQDLIKVIPLDEEREEIEQIETQLLLEYLKQIINYLVKSKIKLEQKIQQFIKPEEECMNEYEGLLQKLEAECRQHIRVEQQLKICAETAQEKLEFAEKDLEVLEKSNILLQTQINELNSTNEELINLNKKRDEKIENLKIRVKEFEDQLEKANLQTMHSSSALQPKLSSKMDTLPNCRGSIEGNHNDMVGIMQSGSGKGVICSNENTSQKNGLSNRSNQNAKRTQRSISSVNHPNANLEHGASSYREVMRQLEDNNMNGRLVTEPYQNHSQANLGGHNSNPLKSTNTHNQHHYTMNTNSSNPYSQQEPITYVLGNSNYKASSSSSQQNINRSLLNSREDKRVIDKYLFDKGEGGAKKIYNESGKAKHVLDLNKSAKSNSARVHSNNVGSKGSGSGQLPGNASQQQILIKSIHQQQIMKQVQSQAVLNRIQQKITCSSSGQNGGSSKNSNGNSSSGHSNNANSGAGVQYPGVNNQQIQQALSRSKSRTKFKEYNNESQRNTNNSNSNNKEYNIYTINPPHGQKIGQVKGSPSKQKLSQDSYRSQSVDAYKINNNKSSYTIK